ncbi:hypothetical protein WJX74_000604 [Apatococcus lobatus]|uniref:Ndc10 domain-containing protein n=1 Tax=Apatococcus lobatus TaxID=904363 RepID=A0AAW1RFB1_9CHLO
MRPAKRLRKATAPQPAPDVQDSFDTDSNVELSEEDLSEYEPGLNGNNGSARPGRLSYQPRALPIPSPAIRPAAAAALLDGHQGPSRPSMTEPTPPNTDADVGGQGLSTAERKKIAADKERSARPKTRQAYKTHTDKLKHFETHDERGRLRPLPWSTDTTTKVGLDNMVRYLQWAGANFPGYKHPKKAAELSNSMLEAIHAAAAGKYRTEHLRLEDASSRKPNLMNHDPYRAVYDTIRNNLAQKGQRASKHRDPQEGVSQEALTPAEYDMMIKHHLRLGATDSRMVRDLSMITLMSSSLGRTDDCRLVYICDLCPPEILGNIGPCPAVVISAVIRGGKTMKHGKTGFLGFIRHSLPTHCPQRALAAQVHQLHVIDGAPLPSPEDAVGWNSWATWPANSPQYNVSYDQLLDRITACLTALEISSRKKLHCFRVLGARRLDAAGCPAEVIARAGRWLDDVMCKSYLPFYTPEGLLASGGWPIDKPPGLFWAPRFMVVIPARLVDLIYPFLPSLKLKIASLGSAAKPSHLAVPKVLQYLGLVVVQDALELAEEFPDDPIHRLLMNDGGFVELHNDYVAKKQNGSFERVRPRSQAEQTAALQHAVTEMYNLLQAISRGETLPVSSAPALRDVTNTIPSLPGSSGHQQAPAIPGAIGAYSSGGPSTEGTHPTSSAAAALEGPTAVSRSAGQPQALIEGNGGASAAGLAPREAANQGTSSSTALVGVVAAPGSAAAADDNEGSGGAHAIGHALGESALSSTTNVPERPTTIATARAVASNAAPGLQMMLPDQRAEALAYSNPVIQQLPPAFSHHLAVGPSAVRHAISHVPPREYAAPHSFMLQEGWVPPHGRHVLPQTSPFVPALQQLQVTLGNGMVQTFTAQPLAPQPQTAHQQVGSARMISSFPAPEGRGLVASASSTAAPESTSHQHAQLPAVMHPPISPTEVHPAPPDHRSIPKLSSIGTVARLWELYDVGDSMSGKKAWRVLEEEEQSSWRSKQRQRWNEVNAVASSIIDSARSSRPTRSGAQIAAEMDREREEMKKRLPSYVEHIIKKRRRQRNAGL